MNLFLDTSILYNDPLWNGNFATQIAEAADNNKLQIYISQVVLDELRHNFIKDIRSKNDQLVSLVNKIIFKTKLSISSTKIQNKELKELFNDFYSSFIDKKNINLVNTTDNSLRESLERAIHKTKPFSENRKEFKDIVIWLSYAEFAQNNDLEDCFLLSDNVQDFAASYDKNELHRVLTEDHESFQLRRSFQDFFQGHKDLFASPEEDFSRWIEEERIDDDYVYGLLQRKLDHIIVEEIDDYFDNFDPNYLVGKDYQGIANLAGGYTEVQSLDWWSCNNLQIDLIKESALISGTLIIGAEIDIYGYNSVRDSGDVKFPSAGSKYFDDIQVNFVLEYDEDREVKDFEVLEVIAPDL